MSARSIVFLFNFVQDVNVLRGIVYLAARETDGKIIFLVSTGFHRRDLQKIWQVEVSALAEDVGAAIHPYATVQDAIAVLEGGSGLILAGSESSLKAHWETRDVFRAAPPSYVKVTLQHGFECVGFRQGREHVISHGRNVTFGADVVCAWFEEETLTSLVASERAKLYVSGPPALLYRRANPQRQSGGRGGLVCENLHSVRHRASVDHTGSFLETFRSYCDKLAEAHRTVTLRPHPGGQYVLKNKVALPRNVTLDMSPIYRSDLASYEYGISAPSTVLFDMVLAGLPVGLWRDPGGVMDASSYDGLTEISTMEDWLAFERDVRLRPDMILARQKAFLASLAMPTDPQDVYSRFARLIVAGLNRIAGAY